MKLAAVIPAFIGLVVFWWLFHGIGFQWDAATQSEVAAPGDIPLVAAIVGGIAGLPFFLVARHLYGKGGGNFHVDIRSVVCLFLWFFGGIFAVEALLMFSHGPSWSRFVVPPLVALIVFSPFWFTARIIWKARCTYL